MKPSDGACAYVAEAAIEWNQARREANRLRGLRASFRCEHECEAEYDDSGHCTAEAEPPCWRVVHETPYGERRPSMSEWCEPCRQRQAVHEQYTKAVAHRQGLMRGLQRRALTAWESLQSAPARLTNVEEHQACGSATDSSYSSEVI
jgi:hypothetical protein